MLQVKDRIKELTTTSGTGTLQLSGTAEAGFQAFSILANNTKTYYTISDVNGTDFEVGEGTYNANTLTRDTIFESSNSGNAISLSATGSTVFVTYPAEKSSYRDIGVNRDYEASGSVGAGKPLILNADNTVSQVAETSTSASTISSSSAYPIAEVWNYERDISVAYDTVNNKIGVLYVDPSSYPKVVIGEESNNTITWGTPVMVSSTQTNANLSGQKLAYGNGVFLASYRKSSNGYNYIKAGVYSGTNSITFGSDVRPNSGVSHFSGGTVAYNSNASKFIYTFAENNTSSIFVYLIGNTSTSISVGNYATITMGYSSDNKVIWNEYDPDTNKQVIMTDHLYANEGRIYQASISGANITVPSTYYAITDEGTDEDGSKALSYDPDNDKWILFKAQAGNVTRANVLTASGDTFTSGTVTQISSEYMRWLAPYYDTEKNKTVLVYQKYTSPYNGKMGFVTISGTTPSFTASTTTLGNQTAERVLHNASLYNPDTKSGIVVSATPLSNTKATGYVLYYETLTSSNLTTDNFFGVSLVYN